jgi:hypothetical protein
LAEQPCGTEVVVVVATGVAVAAVVVVELDDVCATTPATPTIESATAAATRKTAIFFMTVPPFLWVDSTLTNTPDLVAKSFCREIHTRFFRNPFLPRRSFMSERNVAHTLDATTAAAFDTIQCF